MILRSIRWRLQAWYGGILVLLVTGFAVVTYALEAARQQRQTDGELLERVSLLAAGLRSAPGPVGPPGPPRRVLDLTEAQREFLGRSGGRVFQHAVWLRDGRVQSQSDPGPEPIPRPDPGEASPRLRGGRREAFAFLATGDCVLVGRAIAEDAAELRQLAVTLGGSAAGIALLGLIGGWWIAGRAIRPIEDISAAAARIASGDLTQRIQTSDQSSELGGLARVLNATFARLEAAFVQQVRFTSDAAHELRTPVSVILTQAQTTLARERSPEEYRESIGTVQRAARRMKQLIESLLELARFDAGREELKRTSCDLAAIASDAAELLAPLLKERRVTLNLDLQPAACRAAPARLGQVAANLLTNAIQHGRLDGTVMLATRAEESRVVLEVSDDGPGLSEKDRAHVFERFYRGDPSRTGGGKGRGGLGLSICLAIVEAHGGSITASLAPAGGARFTVRLPA